jgi:hypothetical protein
MEYKQKYFKYKAKYLNLKNQIGRGDNIYLQELIKVYNSKNPFEAVARIPPNPIYNSNVETLKYMLSIDPSDTHTALKIILSEICRIDTTNSSGLCH